MYLVSCNLAKLTLVLEIGLSALFGFLHTQSCHLQIRMVFLFLFSRCSLVLFFYWRELSHTVLARGKGSKGQGEIHLAFHHWHRVGCGFYRGPSRWRRDPVLSVKECGTSQILPLHLWGASHGILLWYVTVGRCSDFCWDDIIAFVGQNLTWL